MRLVTFQDKYVYNYLYKLNNTVYENINHFVLEDSMVDLVNKTVNKMKNSIVGIPADRTFLPIWAWVIKNSDELDDELLSELFTRYTPKCCSPIMIEMEVPNKYLTLMNFDLWYDFVFETIFKDKIYTDAEFNKLFEKQKGARLQAVLPLIHKDWIKNIRVYDNPADYDYSQTDNEISDLINSGKITLNDDGMIESFN